MKIIREGIHECKRQQHSVIALMLIQHVSDMLAVFDPIINNKINTELLARQYGISIKSVGSALNPIIRGDWDRKSIRKRTEILDDFESAKEHFRQLSAEKAIILLDQLEQKILQAPPKKSRNFFFYFQQPHSGCFFYRLSILNRDFFWIEPILQA